VERQKVEEVEQMKVEGVEEWEVGKILNKEELQST